MNTTDGKTYCLVEAEFHQLRIAVNEQTLDLGHDMKELKALAKTALDSDEDLQWATASDPGKPKKKKSSRKQRSESSSSSEDSGDEGVLLRQSWLGSGSEKGRGRRSSEEEIFKSRKTKRFALLDKKKGKGKKDSTEKQVQQAALQAATQSSDPLHGLLALHLAESMNSRKKGKSKKSTRSSSSRSSSMSSNSSSESSGGPPEKGHARAVNNYRRDGKRKFRNPVKHVRKFIKGIEQELGAEDRPFRVTDYTRRIQFGKQQNLRRCHFLVATILELLLKEKPEKAALMAVVSLQAMHQAALDQSWDVAWLLTYQEDPFRAKAFGGDPNALQYVTAYLRSMHDLNKSTEALRKKGSGKGEEAEPSKDGGAKGKGKQNKSKEKEKDKDKVVNTEG
eukprot:Skav206776  [mRNA]  locus=scaffold1075:41705:42883:+ [translate_table: standard]